MITMASGTRGNQDLKNLRNFVGPGNPLPIADLPSLRDVLAAGIYLKEMSWVVPNRRMSGLFARS